MALASIHFSNADETDGFDSSTQENPIDQEQVIVTAILGLDVGLYLLLMLFRELTRVVSKFGFSFNPCCFQKYLPEIIRDQITKILLRITASVSVLALIHRMDDSESFRRYILDYTPLTIAESTRAQNFVQYFVIPILIFRSYKRCQFFNHSIHIAIIISFALILSDYTLYMYESAFIVLALPLFPYNPFPALFLTPFSIPKKLRHKNECCYRVAYLIVNILTGFAYFLTLGLLDLTMIFGLPMYWCVVPSTYAGGGKPSVK